MKIASLVKIEDHFQSVLVSAILDMDIKEIQKVTLTSIHTGYTVEVADLDFFADELNKFRCKIKEILEGTK